MSFHPTGRAMMNKKRFVKICWMRECCDSPRFPRARRHDCSIERHCIIAWQSRRLWLIAVNRRSTNRWWILLHHLWCCCWMRNCYLHKGTRIYFKLRQLSSKRHKTILVFHELMWIMIILQFFVFLLTIVMIAVITLVALVAVCNWRKEKKWIMKIKLVRKQ